MTTHSEFWSQYAKLFCSDALNQWGELWQPDGQFTVAYPLGGMPATITGREEIVKGMKLLAKLVKSIEVLDSVVFSTTDSSVFFVEYNLVIKTRARDPYESPIVSKVTLQDGKIAELKEYYDSQAYQRFMTTMGFRA